MDAWRQILFHYTWMSSLFLNNRASITVLVESVEKRLEIPSIESAIEHRLELRF